MTPEQLSSNPYVGPRTFSREQGGLFFGREQEARDLLGRVISERLLLFYAQSGAGKSSLINARLIPGLEDEGFAVLPVGRVSGELPPGVSQVENIYLVNLMASLDQSGDDPQRFAKLSLSDFLARLATEDGKHWEYDPSPVGASLAPALAAPALVSPAPTANGGSTPSQHFVLIVDQFEEIVTTHAERWHEREGFFRQLDQAMAGDPNLWVVLTLREDYVAALDPYASLMADRLRARFYMERMGATAALEAVKRPAASFGRPFAAGVAEKLVDDLRQVRAVGQEGTALGPTVEPVQLQVVCYQLWERLQGAELQVAGEAEDSLSATTPVADLPPATLQSATLPPATSLITATDLAAAGDVNQALEQFYTDTLASVLAEPEVQAAGVTERALREWFDKELITETGIRNTVFRNEKTGKTGTITNVAVDALSRRFLLRTELRSGGEWVELVHDRFVEPIRANNAAWFPLHLSALQRQAALWDEQGRSAGLLLRDAALAEAEAWAAAHPDELALHEQDFLTACREAQQAVEREQRQSRRIRMLAAAAVAISILAIGAAIFALNQTQQARENAKLAEDRIAQVGQLVGDLGIERLLSMAGQLDEAGDTSGATTLLQTTVNLHPALLAELNEARLTTDTLKLLASVSLVDKNGANYIFIPPGEFTMGDSLNLLDERPRHSVYLSHYWIGRTEVTNEQYAAFVETTGHAAPWGWENGSVPSGKGDHPVEDVSWNDAVAFTKWLSEQSGMIFRLCTEAEWEKACRGTDSLTYPWGDEFESNRANVFESGPYDTTPVGKYSPDGDSPYGVADMGGNAREWVADWYSEDYYTSSPAENPQGPDSADQRVVRGGHFAAAFPAARCAYRSYNDAASPYNQGLRVCVSAGLSTPGQ